MATRSFSRRDFSSMALATTAAAGLGLHIRPAAAQRSDVFHLQHWSSTKAIHPYRGRPGNDVPLVTYGGVAPQTQYFFEFKEGPWGYIVSAMDPRFCVHPAGGSVDAGNDTSLFFHEGRHPGAYFAFNQKNGTIMHVSGRFWHPYGGSAQPGDNNRVVLFDGWRNATKFGPTNGDVFRPVRIDLPATPSLGWNLVFADDNPLADRVHRFKKTIGLTTQNTRSTSTSSTVGIEMEGSLFGVGSTASASLTSTFASEDSRTWSESQEIDDEYSIKAGSPVAVWQKVYKASFTDGTVFNYLSAKVTYDTRNSMEMPPIT
jgi:hypothetical protein